MLFPWLMRSLQSSLFVLLFSIPFLCLAALLARVGSTQLGIAAIIAIGPKVANYFSTLESNLP